MHSRVTLSDDVRLRACLHGGGGPHLSCKRDQIKMRDYVERRVTSPKRVTSPTWGPPPPFKQALIFLAYFRISSAQGIRLLRLK